MTPIKNNILSEENIRKIAQNDDEQSFKKFFDYFYPRLLKLALYFLESPQAAEEIVSTVFIGIWNNRKKLIHIKKIEAYLFSSVKNKSFSYLRDNRRIHFVDLDNAENLLCPKLDGPENQLLNKEVKTAIFAAIDQLPPRCKMIFLLIRDDGLKYKEVAELLDISHKTVEAQMGRALIKLREILLPQMDALGIDTFRDSKIKRAFLSLLF